MNLFIQFFTYLSKEIAILLMIVNVGAMIMIVNVVNKSNKKSSYSSEIVTVK